MKRYIISFVVCLLLCLTDNSVFAQSPTHEFVDLGLPSGTLWATTNIGAEKPEDFGNYYSWGETETKKFYNLDHYKGYKEGYDQKNGGGVDADGFEIPEKTIHVPESYLYGNNIIGTSLDAVTKVWGYDWCMPSKHQMQELLDNCEWQWTTKNGVKGYKITSKFNDNWIFLPAGHLKDNINTGPKGMPYPNEDMYGDYWAGESSDNNVKDAFSIHFTGYSVPIQMSTCYRDHGLTIRPVRNKSYSKSSDLNNLEEADSTTIFTVVETVADFPGGSSALMEYLNQNLQYPDAAAQKGIEGRVHLSFVVEKDGSISDIKEVRSPDESLTIEAIRVLSMGPKWQPATQRGKPVRSRFFLPITFRQTSSNQTK